MSTTLRSLTALLLLAFALVTALAQTAAPPADAPAFTLKPLGHDVYAAIDANGKAGANAGFVIGSDSVLVVDTFEHEPAAQQLLAEIHKRTPLPVKYVVNTHYHLDHVAGNRVFQQAGATIIAQRNVPGWIHTENLKFFGKNIKPEQKSLVEALGAPDRTYTDSLDLSLGSVAVSVRYFPGHTGGDSVVFIPAATVVFCGDLFWNATFPNLIDASTVPWISTLDSLLKSQPAATAFVPGHGDTGNTENVAAFRDYLKNLREILSGPVQSGKSDDELVASVLPQLEEKYGQWHFFKYFAKPNILDTAAELRGSKRVPQPVP
jgi:glyoxylase-like metal-dependent hydrolase (beta-lactamase superfamily II)